MALPIPQPQNFLDALMEGYETAQKTKQQNILNRAQDIERQMNEFKLQHMPEEFQSEQKKNQLANLLTQAEIQHYNALSKKEGLPSFQSPMGKALADYQFALKSGDKNQIKAMEDYLNKLSAVSQGVQFESMPGGGFSINMGGQTVPGAYGTNRMIRDPRFGTQKSGAGGTYAIQNPDGTITYTSSPTGQMTTRLQKGIIGAQQVEPYLKDVLENLPQFQTASGQIKLKAAQLGNFLGISDFDLPSKYAAGRAALLMAPESLLSAFNLNPTVEAIKQLQDAINPIPGESAQGYARRIARTLNQIKEKQLEQQQILTGGIPLNTPLNEEKSMIGNISQSDLQAELNRRRGKK